MFTDTDSLTCEVKSENPYEELFKWKNLFDFRNYSKDSKFFDDTNKKVIGKIKDEFGGIIATEFVGLNSKIYSIKKIDGKESSTAKRVAIATEFNEFKDVLFNQKIKQELMKFIKYHYHALMIKDIF